MDSNEMAEMLAKLQQSMDDLKGMVGGQKNEIKVPPVTESVTMYLEFECAKNRDRGDFFYILGGVRPSSNFYPHDRLERNCSCFDFHEISTSGKATKCGGKLYCEQKYSGRLFEAALEQIKQGYTGQLAKLKVRALPHEKDWFLVVTDYQFVSQDRTGWTDWQINPRA